MLCSLSPRHKSVPSIEDIAPSVTPDTAMRAPPRWRELLRYRQVWAIVASRFLTDPVWWLYITWLPKYFTDARGFSLTKIGLFAWVPFVAADAGSLTGGWFVWLLNRSRLECGSRTEGRHPGSRPLNAGRHCRGIRQRSDACAGADRRGPVWLSGLDQ